MIKVGFIGNSQLHRKALVLAVNSFDNISVAIDADNLFSFIGGLKNDTVDVVIIDIPLPDVISTGICQILKNNLLTVKILLIVTAPSAENRNNRLPVDADGFISADIVLVDLENAIENVIVNRQKMLKRGHFSGLKKNYSTDNATRCKVLQTNTITKRELDVIKLIGKEFSSAQIAEKLSISVNTVESHRKKIMEKTASKNFIGVLIYAMKNNLIKINDLSTDHL